MLRYGQAGWHASGHATPWSFAVLAGCLAALGCGTTWVRADGGDFYEKQLRRDMEGCRVHLETRADVTRPFADCMRERGWVPEAKP